MNYIYIYTKGAAGFVGRLLHILLTLSLLLSLLTLPAGCSGQEPTLRIGVMPDLDSIPLMAAKQAGYLPDAIILEVYKSPTERDSALYSGHLDGAVSDLLAAFLAADSGEDYKALTVTDGCYKLVAAAHTDIRTPAALTGKTLGLSLHTIIEYAADRMLLAAGIEPASVQKQAVPSIPVRLELLKAGKLDAAVLPEPYASEAVNSGGHLLASSADQELDAGLLLFSGKAFSEKPNLLAALIQGYNRAAAALREGRGGWEDAAAALGLPNALTAGQLPAYRDAALPGEQDLEEAARWLTQGRLLSQPPQTTNILGDLKGLMQSHG